jgi:hypothetical protein
MGPPCAAGVESNLPGVDTAQGGVAASQFQPIHHIGVLHEPEVQQHTGNAGPDRNQFHSLLGIHPRLVRRDCRDQEHALVQHALTLN